MASAHSVYASSDFGSRNLVIREISDGVLTMQAAACADAGAALISPFVGRILDWYKKAEGRDFTGAQVSFPINCLLPQARPAQLGLLTMTLKADSEHP